MSSRIGQLSFFAFLFILSFSIGAQTEPSSRKPIAVIGTIFDPHGAVVVGASVSSSSKIAESRRTKTDIEGKYLLDLAPGDYKISIEAPGFKKFEFADFRVVNSTFGKMSFDFVIEPNPNFDHEPCGYGGHECFADEIPIGIKSLPPVIDTRIQPRPIPKRPQTK